MVENPNIDPWRRQQNGLNPYPHGTPQFFPRGFRPPPWNAPWPSNPDYLTQWAPAYPPQTPYTSGFNRNAGMGPFGLDDDDDDDDDDDEDDDDDFPRPWSGRWDAPVIPPGAWYGPSSPFVPPTAGAGGPFPGGFGAPAGFGGFGAPDGIGAPVGFGAPGGFGAPDGGLPPLLNFPPSPQMGPPSFPGMPMQMVPFPSSPFPNMPMVPFPSSPFPAMPITPMPMAPMTPMTPAGLHPILFTKKETSCNCDCEHLAARPGDWRYDYNPPRRFRLPSLRRKSGDRSKPPLEHCHLSPILLMPNSKTPVLSFDLRADHPFDPASLELLTTRGRPFNPTDLAQLATARPVSRLRFYHPRLPWYADVRAAQPNGVLVADVLHQLHARLHRPIRAHDFANTALSAADRELITSAYRARCDGRVDVMHHGVRQVDFMGPDVILQGFVEGKNGMWLMKTTRYGRSG